MASSLWFAPPTAQGNEEFRQGKYAAAVECYTRGLASDEDNAVLYANRAMAQLKLKTYREARADAQRAVELDPKYVKAHNRLATALTALGEYKAAISSWEAVVRLEPDNKQARTELEATRRKLEQHLEQQRKEFNPMLAARQSAAAGSASSSSIGTRRDRKPLVRIPIQEVGEPRADEEAETPASQVSSSVEISPKAKTVTSTPPAAATDRGAGAGATVTKKKGVVIEEVEAVPEPSATPDKDARTPPAPGGSSKQAGASLPPSSSRPAVAATARSTQASASSPQMPPVTPEASAGSSQWTPYAFAAAWQNASDSTSVAAILHNVEAVRLTDLLSQFFDANVLVQIVQALHQQFLPNKWPVVPVLRAVAKVRTVWGKKRKSKLKTCVGLLLSEFSMLPDPLPPGVQIPRFDMVVMFLDDAEKTLMQGLLAAVEKAETADGKISDKLLARLKEVYGV